MKKILALTVAAFFLVGCPSKPVKYEDAKPSTKVYAFQDDESAAQVLVTRDSGLAGSACDVNIYIDNTLAAKLSASERAIFYVEKGEHIIGAEHGSPCFGTLKEIDINASLEKPTRLRVSVSIDGTTISKTAF